MQIPTEMVHAFCHWCAEHTPEEIRSMCSSDGKGNDFNSAWCVAAEAYNEETDKDWLPQGEKEIDAALLIFSALARAAF